MGDRESLSPESLESGIVLSSLGTILKDICWGQGKF